MSSFHIIIEQLTKCKDTRLEKFWINALDIFNISLFGIIIPNTIGSFVAYKRDTRHLSNHFLLWDMALLHESYSGYGFRLLFVCQLLFSIRYDSGLPKWIIRLRMAQPRRLSTCWLAQLRALSVSPMRCL